MRRFKQLSPYLLLVIPYLAAICWVLYQMDYSKAWGLVLLPFGLAVLSQLYRRFTGFLFFMVFLTPLSINLVNIGGGVGMSLPMEIMLALSAVFALAWLLWDGFPPRSFLLHPVSLIIGLQFLWILVTSATSSYQSISMKFTIARMTYLLVFYLLFARLFLHKGNIPRFIWTYVLGIVPVMIYSFFRLSTVGFGRRYSPDMAEPFFDDHTVFGACLAMLFPLLLIWRKKRYFHLEGLSFARYLPWITLLTAVTIAMTFSRAAWMSLVLAGGFYLLLQWKVPFRAVAFGISVILCTVWFFKDPLVEAMRKNENVSGENIIMTAKSVTNVQSDESNAERVNRWSCALRMGLDKPWLGFGPGTYESNYPDYQIKSEMTRISSKDGTRGDAHSEYMTALSEQGFPGLLIWLALVAALLRTGMRTYYRSLDEREKCLVLGLLLGMLTYVIHGMVNSFLDIEKAAVLFWAFASAIVGLDLRSKAIQNIPLN